MNGRMSAESLEAEREQNEDKLWLFGSTFDEPAPPSPQDQAGVSPEAKKPHALFASS